MIALILTVTESNENTQFLTLYKQTMISFKVTVNLMRVFSKQGKWSHVSVNISYLRPSVPKESRMPVNSDTNSLRQLQEKKGLEETL